MALVDSTLADIVTKVRRLTASPGLINYIASSLSSLQNTSLHSRVLYIKHLRRLCKRKTAVVHLHNDIHNRIKIFGGRSSTSYMSSLIKFVTHVIFLRPDPQVIRVDAPRIITRMTDKETIWYWAIKQGITVPMSAKIISLYGKDSIPKFMCSSFPEPARCWIIRNIYLFNKTSVWKRVLFSSKKKVIGIAAALVTAFMQNKASIRYIAKEKLVSVSVGLSRFISDRKSALSSFLGAPLEYPTANRRTVFV